MSKKELCLSLMRAETEDEVINILKENNYWDDESVWRWYGNRENNYKDAGNQTSDPDAALVEKLTNSRDARLMGACREAGVEPESDSAPTTMEEAVARFFSDNSELKSAGKIKDWTSKKRTEIARGITLATTGNKPAEGYPCITIADLGEGQTPSKVPSTILSIGENTKMRIPFVQGKFNMGGTAALRFCGHHNLQLLVTKRNPSLLKEDAKIEDENWGFTIVRRLYPKGNFETALIGKDKTRSSIYIYLAPTNNSGSFDNGEILNFSSKTLPIFPEKNNAYSKHSEWGTLIKLYEFRTKSRTHMFREGGLLTPLDILLPKIGLPVRLHECRAYRGHEGSFETTLTGLRVRLEDDKEKNLEEGFPDSSFINIDGNEFKVTIYAFKDGKARSYRKADKGVIFTVNGQTQGSLHERFFARERKVKMNYIKDSILVIVDCSKINWDAQEMLFMNNREHLSKEPIRYKLESKLEELVKEHEGLRALKEKRRRERKTQKLENSNAFEKVLQKVFKNHKAIAAFFSLGTRMHNPIKSEEVASKKEPFNGELFPSFFKFRKIDYGESLIRNCHLKSRIRIIFETNVKNDYFDRNIDPGTFEIFQINEKGEEIPVHNYTINPFNGRATLNLEIPDGKILGDKIHLITRVNDVTRVVEGPFTNKAIITVCPEVEEKKPGKPGNRVKPPGLNGKGREGQSQLSIPIPTEVYQEKRDGSKAWSEFPEFNQDTALYVTYSGEEDADFGGYDFFINMDNQYLKMEIGSIPVDADITMEQYKIAMVLIGMSMIHKNESKAKKEDADIESDDDVQLSISDKVGEFTSMVAPIIIPLVNDVSEIREVLNEPV